jgi:hypothetical protein
VVVGPRNKLSAVFQTDEDLAAFSSWRTAAIKNLRATAGSKGLRLNQAEIELAVENDIPRITDTVDVARRKMANLSIMFDNAEKAVFGGRGAGPKASPTKGEPDAASGSAAPAGGDALDAFLKKWGEK